MYKCAGCGMKVIIYDNQIFRPCHCQAGVVVELQATAKGTAKLN